MKRVLFLIFTVLFVVAINAGIYFTITRKTGNNNDGTTQLKMIDLGRYLPFEEESDLARVDSSLKLTEEDDLPVLDGAAALVPVYASP